MAPKYRLDPEELQVETFATEKPKDERGTVFGHWTNASTCIQVMCECTYAVGPGMGTCDLSCMDPCEPTNINCGGGGSAGCSGETCGCENSMEQTCCTGRQLDCSCIR
jgi:hypothetical protein